MTVLLMASSAGGAVVGAVLGEVGGVGILAVGALLNDRQHALEHLVERLLRVVVRLHVLVAHDIGVRVTHLLIELSKRLLVAVGLARLRVDRDALDVECGDQSL